MIDGIIDWLIGGVNWVVTLLPPWPPTGWEASNASGLAGYYAWAGGWIDLCAWGTIIALWAVLEFSVITVHAVVWLIDLIKP